MPSLVDTRDLTPAVKQQLWRGIRKLNPALADGLQNDPVGQQIRELTGATPAFYIDEYQRYMKD